VLYYSYLAVHPETKVAGYAGVTSQLSTMPPSNAVKRTKPIDAWLQVLAARQLVPEIVITGKFFTRQEAQAHEAVLLRNDPNLLNTRPPPFTRPKTL
jgi:hypothetical protein